MYASRYWDAEMLLIEKTSVRTSSGWRGGNLQGLIGPAQSRSVTDEYYLILPVCCLCVDR